MNDKMISFEERVLEKKLRAYEADLKTNYLIVKRKDALEAEINMEQYDLFHIQTQEPYMVLSFFPDLGLIDVHFTESKIACALALDSSQPITKLETMSVDEIKKKITYIQFTETDLYSNNLEPFPKLDEIEESPYFETYLRVLIAIQSCLTFIAKLYV